MVTAIRAGWLWDGVGDEAVRDGVVVIDGERIAAVGPAATVTIPDGAEVIVIPTASCRCRVHEGRWHVMPCDAGSGSLVDAGGGLVWCVPCGDPGVSVLGSCRCGRV